MYHHYFNMCLNELTLTSLKPDNYIFQLRNIYTDETDYYVMDTYTYNVNAFLNIVPSISYGFKYLTMHEFMHYYKITNVYGADDVMLVPIEEMEIYTMYGECTNDIQDDESDYFILSAGLVHQSFFCIYTCFRHCTRKWDHFEQSDNKEDCMTMMNTVESIKCKISDNEYKTILDCLMRVYKNSS
jgi:hypothetical protein